jgi:hypothetical protein
MVFVGTVGNARSTAMRVGGRKSVLGRRVTSDKRYGSRCYEVRLESPCVEVGRSSRLGSLLRHEVGEHLDRGIYGQPTSLLWLSTASFHRPFYTTVLFQGMVHMWFFIDRLSAKAFKGKGQQDCAKCKTVQDVPLGWGVCHE